MTKTIEELATEKVHLHNRLTAINRTNIYDSKGRDRQVELEIMRIGIMKRLYEVENEIINYIKGISK